MGVGAIRAINNLIIILLKFNNYKFIFINIYDKDLQFSVYSGTGFIIILKDKYR